MLLNNYYMFDKCCRNGSPNYDAITTSSSANSTLDYRNYLGFILTNGYTVKQVLDNHPGISLEKYYDSTSGISYLNNASTSHIDTPGAISIGSGLIYQNAGYDNVDTGDAYTTRTTLTNYVTYQTPDDILPPMAMHPGDYGKRYRLFFRVGEGTPNDTNPVTLNDYNLDNLTSLNDVRISCNKDLTSGAMIVSMTNSSLTDKTIRQIGVYSPLFRGYIGFDNTNSSPINSLTQTQKNEIAQYMNWLCSLGDIHFEKYNSNPDNFVQTIIPVLLSKTKLTTPIVLQPNETKTMTYEIKWS